MAKETPSKRAKPASGPPRTKATLAGTGQTQPVYAGSKSELAGTGQVVLATVTPKATARAAQRARRAQRQRTRAILRSKPAKAQKRSQPVAFHPPKSLPQSKPPTFKGQRTAGEPSLSELSQAQNEHKLGTNKAGFVTTPGVRKAAKQLKKAKRVLHKTAGKGHLHSPIVQTPEQQHVVRAILRTAQKVGANRKEKLAALATGLQESGMKNLPISGPGGGWRQEESAYYSPQEITNVHKGAENFFNEAKSDTHNSRGRGYSIPNFAQAIQASGAGASYYADNVGEAKSLLHQFNKGKPNPKAVAQLHKAEAQAQSVGLNTKGQGAPNVGPAPKKVVTKFKAIKHYAHELTERHIPYVWGGGHGGFEANPSGLDCSGAVSWVLHKAGVLSTPLTSGSMGSALKPGPGAVTVFYNAEHTFMRIGNEYWGTSVGDSGAGGLGPHPTPSASYLAQYNVGHVPGLGKKQALQLGINPGSGGSSPSSFPGMTLSSSGTTATINQGAGTTQSKPGFTNKPIRLTIGQKVARVERKLRALGTTPKPKEESTGVTLKQLEDKYGKAAV